MSCSDEKAFDSNDHGVNGQWTAPGKQPLHRTTMQAPLKCFTWGAVTFGDATFSVLPSFDVMLAVEREEQQAIDDDEKAKRDALLCAPEEGPRHQGRRPREEESRDGSPR